MRAELQEFIGKISSGCLAENEIVGIAGEAAQAYADPDGFLAANPDVNYDDSYPIPLGEWVVIGSLPDTVLFQADSWMDIFAQILASFGPGVAFTLKPKQLAKAEPLTSVNRIQIQLGALNKEMGGYVLMNISRPMDDELQTVLVYGCDVERVIALGERIGIAIAPALAALRDTPSS